MSHLLSTLKVTKSENYGVATNKPGPDPNFKIKNGGDGDDRVKNPYGNERRGRGEGISYKYPYLYFTRIKYPVAKKRNIIN